MAASRIALTIFCNYTRARGARRFRTAFSFLCLTGEIEPTAPRLKRARLKRAGRAERAGGGAHRRARCRATGSSRVNALCVVSRAREAAADSGRARRWSGF